MARINRLTIAACVIAAALSGTVFAQGKGPYNSDGSFNGNKVGSDGLTRSSAPHRASGQGQNFSKNSPKTNKFSSKGSFDSDGSFNGRTAGSSGVTNSSPSVTRKKSQKSTGKNRNSMTGSYNSDGSFRGDVNNNSTSYGTSGNNGSRSVQNGSYLTPQADYGSVQSISGNSGYRNTWSNDDRRREFNNYSYSNRDRDYAYRNNLDRDYEYRSQLSDGGVYDGIGGVQTRANPGGRASYLRYDSTGTAVSTNTPPRASRSSNSRHNDNRSPSLFSRIFRGNRSSAKSDNSLNGGDNGDGIRWSEQDSSVNSSEIHSNTSTSASTNEISIYPENSAGQNTEKPAAYPEVPSYP